jgi:hypothetical protein
MKEITWEVTWQEAMAASERRHGSAHEEWTQGGDSWCAICGCIETADLSDPLVRAYHADSFQDGPGDTTGWVWDQERSEWVPAPGQA